MWLLYSKKQHLSGDLGWTSVGIHFQNKEDSHPLGHFQPSHLPQNIPERRSWNMAPAFIITLGYSSSILDFISLQGDWMTVMWYYWPFTLLFRPFSWPHAQLWCFKNTHFPQNKNFVITGKHCSLLSVHLYRSDFDIGNIYYFHLGRITSFYVFV